MNTEYTNIDSSSNQLRISRRIYKNQKSANRKALYNKLFIFLKYAVILGYIGMTLYPFLFSLFSSFKTLNDYNDENTKFFPTTWTTESYKQLLGNGSYVGANSMLWIKNSIIYAVSNSGINLVLNFLSGYALAKIAFKGRKLLIWYLLLVVLIPGQLTLYPIYFIMAKLHMLPNDNNVVWLMSILFSSCVNLFLIFMIRQFFMSTASQVDEAAIVDGLSKTRTFFRVTLRMMLPLVATQLMLVFTWSWNNYIAFTLYAGGVQERMTLVVGLSAIAGAYMDPYRDLKILAASNISFIPVLIVYWVSLQFQKRSEIDGDK